IRLEVEKIVQAGPDMVTMGKLPQTPRAKKVIEYSIEEARQLNHNYVGTEHLLLGLLREQEGVAAQVLMNLGLKLEDVRREVLDLLAGCDNRTLLERAARRLGLLIHYNREMWVLGWAMAGCLAGALLGTACGDGDGAATGAFLGTSVL